MNEYRGQLPCVGCRNQDRIRVQTFDVVETVHASAYAEAPAVICLRIRGILGESRISAALGENVHGPVGYPAHRMIVAVVDPEISVIFHKTDIHDPVLDALLIFHLIILFQGLVRRVIEIIGLIRKKESRNGFHSLQIGVDIQLDLSAVGGDQIRCVLLHGPSGPFQDQIIQEKGYDQDDGRENHEQLDLKALKLSAGAFFSSSHILPSSFGSMLRQVHIRLL